MNYRTLILTVLMTVGCMSSAAEHRPQTTTGNSFLNASIWGLGGLTALLGIKTGYHFVQASRYSKKYSQLRDAKVAHNQEVMDLGRLKFEQKFEQKNQFLPKTYTNIPHDEYDHAYGAEYVTDAKECFFVSPSLFRKLNTSGHFALLNDAEKIRLQTRQEKILEENIKNGRRHMHHIQQQLVATALLFASGSALMTAYLLKNRSSQK